MNNTEKKLLIFIPIGALIIQLFVIPNIYDPQIVINALTFAIIISFFPLFFYKFIREKKTKELYDDIRQFFRDLSYYLSLGYSLKKALLLIISENRYSNDEFNKKLEVLKNKIERNYESVKAFTEFLKSLNNPILNSFEPIIRNVIKRSERLDILFKDISEELDKEIVRERKRKEKTYSVLITTYISFFLFITLVVLLIDKVLNFQLSGFKILLSTYISLLTFLVHEESILSGFVIGELVSNEFIEGIVHSFFFIGITYLIFMIFLF
ncbi:MAG: type II secretion system F family protein [Nanoarchaeota archaeon]